MADKPETSDNTNEADVAPEISPTPAETPDKSPVEAEPAEPKPVDEDPKTDALVDEIQHDNSDAELQAAFTPETPLGKRSLKDKYLDHKKWTIPLTIVVLLLVLAFALPTSRYKLLGLAFKKPFTISVTDSTTNTPVSKASVKVGDLTVLTDANGKAVFKHLAVGKKQATITKQYYKTTTLTAFVGLNGSHNSQRLLLQATGRQVPVRLINKITGEPINGAEISALQTNAKTDKTGSTILVVPASNKTVKVTLKADGYNTTSGDMQVTTDVVAGNTFSLVPSGRAYFLSNASGKVDVISANYDGTDRQTLLAGTGFESNAPIQLIPSPDQKSLALIARRSVGSNTLGLYNIDTASGKLTKVEGDGNKSITSVGWSGSNFVYLMQNYDLSQWQPAQEQLRSFSATTADATTLDSTDAGGTSYGDELYQQISAPAIVDGAVVYSKSWSAGQFSANQLSSRNDMIFSIQPNGSNKKTLKEVSIPSGSNYNYINQTSAGPHIEYFAVPTVATYDLEKGALFFKYTKGTLTQLSNFTVDNFNNPDVKGYVATSPSGNKLLYADVIDGKVVVSVSDQSGDKQKLVTLHGPASTPSWLTDDYILVSQDSSQLYVISANPSATKAQPLSLASFYNQAPINR